MKKRIFVVAAIFISSKLIAQISTKDSASQGMQEKALDKITVTASKYERKQSQTAKLVTIIDKQQLQDLQGRTLSEVLNTVTGVTINGANNSPGTNQRISIRGSSDGNVLLLIDGIPANDPSVISNYFDLNFINLSEVERIEILKGSHSTLYGSDAVSGVINIITKKAESRSFSPFASLHYGSYNTINASAGVNGNSKWLHYQTYLAAISTTGFSSAADTTGSGNFDKDGLQQYIFKNDLSFQLSQSVNWKFYSSYSHYKADVDAAAFTDDADFTVKNKNLQAGSAFGWKKGNNNLRLHYQFNYVHRFYLDDSVSRGSFAYYSQNKYIGRTHFAELYDNFRKNKWSVLMGGDYRFYNTDQFYRSISQFGPFETELNDSLAKMWQLSSYASVVYNYKGANIELGGRLNHHSKYGNNSTYTFNPSWLVHEKLKLFANLATAFKTPSLFQLFDPYIGNKDLNPEKTKTFEAGFEIYKAAKAKLRTTVFYRQTKQFIQFILTDPIFFTGHYENIARQKNYGAEAEFSFISEKWKLEAGYCFTKGRMKSRYSESGNPLLKDTTFNNLYRVPENAVTVFAECIFDKHFRFNSLLKFTGKRWEPVYASAPAELDSYFTIDATGQYLFNNKMRSFISLKNITNKKYFDVLGYNARRFNFTIGLSVEL